MNYYFEYFKNDFQIQILKWYWIITYVLFLINPKRVLLTLYLSYLFLNIYFLKLLLPCIEEDELHVQLGPEHEHILVQLDFCDGR